MPKFRVTGPDGSVYEVNAPEGATEQEAIAYVQANAARIPKAETSALRDIGGAGIRGVGQVVSLPGQLAGLVTGDFDNVFTRAGQAVEEFGADIQTPAFRAQQEEAQRRVQQAEEEGGFFAGAGQQIRELVTDPLAFGAGIAQTAPSMIGTGGAGAVGRALAGRLAAREGAEQAAIQAARRRGAAVGAGAGAGALTGADAGASVYERVSQMPEETLAQAPAYQEALAAGMTPEDARQEVALSAARQAAIPAAALSAVTAGLGGVESALLGGGVSRGIIRGGLTTGAKEAGQEAIEEGGAAIAENIALGRIDPTIGALDGVGGRSAMGAVLGFGAAAPAGAIAGARGVESDVPPPAPKVPPITPPPPPSGGAGIDTGLAPDGGVAAPVGDTGVGAPPVGGDVAGIRRYRIGDQEIDAEVTVDNDGFLIVDFGEAAQPQVLSPEEFAEFDATFGLGPVETVVEPAPASVEPVGVEPVTTGEPIVEPSPAPIDVEPVVTPPVEPVAEPVSEPAPAPIEPAPVEPTGIEPTLAPEQAREADQTRAAPSPDTFPSLSPDAIATVSEDAPAIEDRIPSLSRKIQRLTTLYNRGRIDEEMFTRSVIELREEIAELREARDIRNAFAPRERGPDYFRQRLLEAKRRGDVEPDLADFSEWAVNWNPRVFDDVAISIRKQPAALSGASGIYNPTERLVSLFKGMANTNTGVHEILHHAERLMPQDVQNRIRTSWKKSLERAKKNATGAEKDFLDLVDRFHTQKDSEAIQSASNLITSDAVPRSFYQYVNPSEFWAVNATDIMRGRYDVRGSALGRLKQWLGEMLERAKGVFGLSDRAEVIKALNSLKNSDGKFQSNRMLERGGGIAMDIAESADVKPTEITEKDMLEFDPFAEAFERSRRASKRKARPAAAVEPETRLGKAKRIGVDRLARAEDIERLDKFEGRERSFTDALRRASSAASEKTKRIFRDTFEQAIEIAKKDRRFGPTEISWFLLAEAAPDRNAFVQKRDTDKLIAKLESENESKLTYKPGLEKPSKAQAEFNRFVEREINKAIADGRIQTAGIGLTNELAKEISDNFKAQPYYPELQRVADLVYKANRDTLAEEVASGYRTQAEVDALIKREPKYVPAQGFAETMKGNESLSISALSEEDISGYGSTGKSISANDWRGFTKGRKSLPFDPFATMQSEVARRLTRSENAVGTRYLMDFIGRNPQLQLGKVFSDSNLPRRQDGTKFKPTSRDKGWVITKSGGKTFYMRIDEPLLERAIKEDDQRAFRAFMEYRVFRLPKQLTRLLARSYTTLQPAFYTVNYVRDIIGGTINLIAETMPGGRLDGLKVTRSFLRNATSRQTFRALFDHQFGRDNPATAEERKMIQRYLESGGTTSWNEQLSPQERAKQMNDQFKELDDMMRDFKKPQSAAEFVGEFRKFMAPGKRKFKTLVNTLENMNSVFENAVRYSAFKSAFEAGKEGGMTDKAATEMAAMVSREVTVDFGTTGEIAPFFNAIYMFFNANVQGTARLLRSASMFGGKKAAYGLSSMMGVMAMVALYNASVSAEDDDGELLWDKDPDWVKRNLVIYNPVTGRSGFVLPLPYGLNFFTGAATHITDAIRKGSTDKLAGRLTELLVNNFSPVQAEGKTAWKSLTSAMTPTLAKPVLELAGNENAFGKPIYQVPFQQGQAMSSVSRYSTPDIYKYWAETLNEIGGGKGKVPSFLDAPPEGIQYVVNFMLGGVGNTVANLFMASAELAGVGEGKKEPGVSDIPIVNRFIVNPSPGRNVGIYYERQETVRNVQSMLKAAENAKERRDVTERFPVESSSAVNNALTLTTKRIRNFNKQLKALQNQNLSNVEKRERQKALREKVDAEYVYFNKIYNEEKERLG